MDSVITKMDDEPETDPKTADGKLTQKTNSSNSFLRLYKNGSSTENLAGSGELLNPKKSPSEVEDRLAN